MCQQCAAACRQKRTSARHLCAQTHMADTGEVLTAAATEAVSMCRWNSRAVGHYRWDITSHRGRLHYLRGQHACHACAARGCSSRRKAASRHHKSRHHGLWHEAPCGAACWLCCWRAWHTRHNGTYLSSSVAARGNATLHDQSWRSRISQSLCFRGFRTCFFFPISHKACHINLSQPLIKHKKRQKMLLLYQYNLSLDRWPTEQQKQQELGAVGLYNPFKNFVTFLCEEHSALLCALAL